MKRTREQVAAEIEAFIKNKGGPWDWDDFISIHIDDPELENIRRRCAGLDKELPPDRDGVFCSAEGIEVLKAYIRQLRS